MNVALKKETKKRSRSGKRKYYAELYAMMGLPLLAVILFSYVPMFGVILAFKDYKFNKGIFGSKWVGLKNFEFFLKSNDFLIIKRIQMKQVKKSQLSFILRIIRGLKLRLVQKSQ